MGRPTGHGDGILARTLPEARGSGAAAASGSASPAGPAGLCTIAAVTDPEVFAASFRAPGRALPLVELLGRGWPGASASAWESLVRAGAVLVQGRPSRKLASRVPPGQRVDLRELAGGVATGDPVPPASDALRALVPSPPWRRGSLVRRRAPDIAFETRREQGGVAEIVLRSDAKGSGDGTALAADARRILAHAGFPVLGDVRHAGILVAGGLRLAAEPGPALAWPDEPVFPGEPDGSDLAGPARLPVLRVSAATARIVGRGHPWVLRDDETGDAGAFAPGTRVALRGPDGQDLGSACIEGAGRLTARRWSAAGEGDRSVEARVAAALARRRALLEPRPGAPPCDAYRLVHGEADGLPGLFVDRLGPSLRALVTSPATRSYREGALDALVRALEPELGSDPPVVQVLHLRERPAGELECTTLARGTASGAPGLREGRLPVHERGVRFLVDPGLGQPLRSSPGMGLYLDQRENRARLARGAAGGRLLNLFAHTGAFSVAWLAAGGAHAVSVDLSAPYLRWLESNLDANGIDAARHESVRQDGRRYLETLAQGQRFDAIVLDPPTAAAAGRRFWSVARELPPLVGRALAHLAPGGRLLVSRNDRSKESLETLVSEAAREAGVRIEAIAAAPAGPDFPALRGFPEGDPFKAVLVRRA